MPFYSIGSSASKIERLLTAEFIHQFTPVYIAKINRILPIILPPSIGKIDQGIWGIYYPKKKVNLWFDSEGIIKNPSTRILVRKKRCLIPANGFFLKHLQNYFFMYFPDEPVVTLAGLYSIDNPPDHNKHNHQFAILTKPAAKKISSYTSRMPVIIHSGARRKYLNPDRPLMDITRLLQKEEKLPINGLEVFSQLFTKENIKKDDFYSNNRKLYPAKKFSGKEIFGNYYIH